MFTVLRRLFLPAVSLVLGCVLLFVAFVLYPVFLCASDTFTSKQIQRHGYVAFHGLVADLSQATTNRTAYIHSQFAGMDISSLVPRMLWLARTPDGSYADKDIRQCVNDPVVADAWLKLALADANGTTLAFQSPQPQQSGTSGTFTTLSKCARPRPLAVTVLDTRRRANLLMLAHQLWGLGELSPVPDEGAIDAQITATERSDLPKPQPPPVDLSVNCLVEPDALRDLFHNVVGHVRIDFDALGLDNDKVQQQREAAIARAVPSSPAKDDLRGGFVNMTDPVPGFGGLVAINDMVFDVAQYLAHATTYLSSNAASPSTRSSEYAVPREGDTMFLSRSVTELLSHAHGRMPLPGGDRDLGWQRLIRSDTDAKGITARSCLVKLFYIGKLSTTFCHSCFARNWLLAATAILTALIAFVETLVAFAAIHPRVLSPVRTLSAMLRRGAAPKDADKNTRSLQSRGHVLFVVPVFAEPTAVVCRALASVVRSHVTNKVLVVVCDGNVRPKGDVKDTWRAVLEQLRYRAPATSAAAAAAAAPGAGDAGVPLRYGSLGQSRKRTNLARIYSGFCTAEDGASVPYIVVVKIGHPWERSASAPGNRGKRDSTHLVARYLHNVLTYPGLNPRTVLSPLEAAIHDALTGANVDPRRIEFLVNVDGDTSIARRAPGVLLDILNTNRDVAAASGSMTITNSFASPWAPVAALRSAIDQHARPASQQTFSRLAIINTAFAAYRVQNPVPAPADLDPMSGVTALAHDPIPPPSPDLRNWGANGTGSINSSNAAPAPRSPADLVLSHPAVLRRMSAPELASAFEQNLFLLGDDRHIATTLALVHPHTRAVYEPRARAYTTVPTGLTGVVMSMVKDWAANLFVALDQVFAPIGQVRVAGPPAGATAVVSPSGRLGEKTEKPATGSLDRASIGSSAASATGTRGDNVRAPPSFLARMSTALGRGMARLYSVAQVMIALTLPFMALAMVAVVYQAVFLRQPASMVSLASWVLVALVHCLLLAISRHHARILELLAVALYGWVLLWVVVPVIGLAVVTRARWVDQWQAEGAPWIRVPGAIADPVAEREADAMLAAVAGPNGSFGSLGSGGSGSLVRKGGMVSAPSAAVTRISAGGNNGGSLPRPGSGSAMVAAAAISRPRAPSLRLNVTVPSSSSPAYHHRRRSPSPNNVTSPNRSSPGTTPPPPLVTPGGHVLSPIFGSSDIVSAAGCGSDASATPSIIGSPVISALSPLDVASAAASRLRDQQHGSSSSPHQAYSPGLPLSPAALIPSPYSTDLQQQGLPSSPFSPMRLQSSTAAAAAVVVLEDESPEKLLGMRASAFRTRAAQALARELARTPLAMVSLPLAPEQVQDLADRVTERLVTELRSDKVALLDHLVLAEVQAHLDGLWRERSAMAASASAV